MIEELNNASQSLAWLPYAIMFMPFIVSFGFILFFRRFCVMLIIGIVAMFGISYWLFGSATQFLFYLSDSFVRNVCVLYWLMFVFSLYIDLKIRFGKME
ncbi:hypothetical protein OFO01_07520 [Campylobacter sp. JMF_01 NE2]|uniref:hypothetical protein n=1 Tax=unclassified Campylobacter TaxID=2593542 RepID=UPI0022E9EFAF|nr:MULTISPECIES: hypothetical protein [unclassified Campylobacter]MDA3053186.1 hypothetical protein [Campylobacter sp. JMF_03 NE3]MDA3067631.1 hypothetical protein [Campylobacter sp. JMF_01 NE2]